jgi:hypothetical protein
MVGPINPVSSSGDGGAGRNGTQRIRPFGVWGNDSDVGFSMIQGPVAGIVTLVRLKYVL